MKKLFLAVLPLLALGLSACGGGDESSSTPKTSSQDTSSQTGGSSEAGSSEAGSSGEASSGNVSSAAGGYTYKATNLPDWITNDGCLIFAWVWSPSDEGSWKSCTYEPDVEKPTYVTLEVTEELTGFLLARCAAGTTTPDWAATGDVAGKVYNKTADITASAGVYEYSAADWVAA